MHILTLRLVEMLILQKFRINIIIVSSCYTISPRVSDLIMLFGIYCFHRLLVHFSGWSWLKTSRSVTGRKSSTLLELIIGFLRTGSSNRRSRWLVININKTTLHLIPALAITQTISTTTTTTTTVTIMRYCILYFVLYRLHNMQV